MCSFKLIARYDEYTRKTIVVDTFLSFLQVVFKIQLYHDSRTNVETVH